MAMLLVVLCICIVGLHADTTTRCTGAGIFADPTDCTKFWECAWANTAPSVSPCPSGLYFNPVVIACDYPCNVDCGTRPLPAGHPACSTAAAPSTAVMETTSSPTVASTSTTSTIATDAPSSSPSPSFGPTGGPLPKKVIGLYLLLADDSVPKYTSVDEWTPALYPYQQQGANVLFFTFINPTNMAVPPAFKTLAATKGTASAGAVPSTTKIIFAVGGQAYSEDSNPWPWLTTQAGAEAMADIVAQWPALYGCDGIDLDIEDGAGTSTTAGQNLVYFARRLKQQNPSMIITQPTYGYPGVQAEIDVINNSWDANGVSSNMASSVGIMYYTGTQSLDYVRNYANGPDQWPGFPITVRVPTECILVGVQGSAAASDITSLAQNAINLNLLGMMAWFSSAKNGFYYPNSQYEDASYNSESQAAYINAMNLFRPYQ